jgi:alkylhydroperoxidase family enzyme
MIRIAPAAPPFDDAVAEDLRKLMPPGMEPLGLFRVLAKNPRVLGRIRRAGLLDPGSITLRQREIVILRTTARARAEYEWSVHAAFFGASAGLDEAQLAATVHGAPDASCWSAEESLLVAACDELHDLATISDATWGALSARFTEPQLLEIIVLAGFYRAIAYVVRGAGVAPEPGAPSFPPRPAPAPARHAGSCLCGGVRYEIDGELGPFGYCHCRSCRKASGSAHAANAPVDRAAFTLLASEPLREYESSPGKHRAFCGQCGSPIYARLDASPDVLRIRLGTLDTPLAARPRAHTFVSDAASWDPIADGLPRFATWADPEVLEQRGTKARG